jgi:hypothetical protein
VVGGCARHDLLGVRSCRAAPVPSARWFDRGQRRLYLGSVPRTLFAVATMTAIVHDDYGTISEDVLRLEEVGKPTIVDDQVLVRVHAASVDRGTWHIRAGLPIPSGSPVSR